MTENEDYKGVFDIKPMTPLQVQELIIGSSEKMQLLNVFNGLMQENAKLKKELESKDGKS